MGKQNVAYKYKGMLFSFKKEWNSPLAGAAQWTGYQPGNRKVTGAIPSEGTCLGCSPDPQLEASKRQPIDVSLTYQLFLSLCSFLPSSLKRKKEIYTKKKNEILIHAMTC